MKFKSIYGISAFIVSTTLLINGCRNPETTPGYEYMPDMYRGPAIETYGQSLENGDSTSALKPVDGTMPRGFTYFNFPASNEGYELASIHAQNPLTSDSVNLAEGKRLYGIYCATCHGESGQGDGSIVASGKFPPPPSYSKGNSSRGGLMKDLTDGKIYHTITYGINMMGSHASQIAPTDRWRVVMFVRSLQNDGTVPATTDSTVAMQ
ncbi:MAG: cytochrome c [Bacteroidia bacterium]|nr:cytochrome c [Bacteroidia bacterium]